MSTGYFECDDGSGSFATGSANGKSGYRPLCRGKRKFAALGYVRDRLHADAAIGVSCATRQERTTTDDRLPGIIGQTQSPRR